MGEDGYRACSLLVYFARCGSAAPIQPARTMSLGDGGEDEAEEADDFRAGRWRYTTSDILVKPGRPPPSRAVEVGADAGAVAAMVSMTRGLQQLRNGLGFGKTLDAEKYTQRRGFVEAGLWRVGSECNKSYGLALVCGVFLRALRADT